MQANIEILMNSKLKMQSITFMSGSCPQDALLEPMFLQFLGRTRKVGMKISVGEGLRFFCNFGMCCGLGGKVLGSLIF